MAAIKQATTFWQFLQNNKIEIPIIQRDYAQGRKGEEKLREKFIKDLKESLDSKTTLKLDFVYGSEENGSINPLDGQQRLTTLWLLHWYIAYKAGRLADNKEVFKRFTYETRVSSREFCERLSEFAESQPVERDIVTHVTNQTWFYSAWEEDPTIQAMLNMLGGTGVKEKGSDIKDGLEEVFASKNQAVFEDYWKKLTNTENPEINEILKPFEPTKNYPVEVCPIVFYYLPLENFGLSDDLYIKMNARGLPLTDFENFKADLIKFVRDRVGKQGGWDIASSLGDEHTEEDTTNRWLAMFYSKLDNTWTDVFWRHKSEKSKIDEIYFAFLNRYFLNCIITAKGDNTWTNKGGDWAKGNKTFQVLYGKEGNDSTVKYGGFDVYEEFGHDVFLRLSNTFDNFRDENVAEYCPIWVSAERFKFIPQYANKSITVLTQPQRVVFHAVCRYFECRSISDNANFRQWMRVVWNIVENITQGTWSGDGSTMIGAIRLIDELGEHSHHIYHFLGDGKPSADGKITIWENAVTSDSAKEQVEEERQKAFQILKGTARSDDKTWEEIIIEAESNPTFKGAIRFLYRDGTETPRWENFSKKVAHAKEVFNNGIIEIKRVEWITAFIKQLTSFPERDNHGSFFMFFNFSADNWKRILLNSSFHPIIDRLLLCDDLSGVESAQTENDYRAVREQILDDGVINCFLMSYRDGRFKWVDNTFRLYAPGKHRESHVLFDIKNQNRNATLRQFLVDWSGVGLVVTNKKLSDRLWVGNAIEIDAKQGIGKTAKDYEWVTHWWNGDVEGGASLFFEKHFDRIKHTINVCLNIESGQYFIQVLLGDNEPMDDWLKNVEAEFNMATNAKSKRLETSPKPKEEAKDILLKLLRYEGPRKEL